MTHCNNNEGLQNTYTTLTRLLPWPPKNDTLSHVAMNRKFGSKVIWLTNAWHASKDPHQNWPLDTILVLHSSYQHQTNRVQLAGGRHQGGMAVV